MNQPPDASVHHCTAIASVAANAGGRALKRFVSLLMLLSLAVAVLGNLASAGAEAELGAGTLMLRGLDGDREAPRLATRVEIAASGMLARVSVRQRFQNPGTDFVEGLYLFPLPNDAAVDQLRLRIGERVIVGEIREKNAARKTYARARASGQRASLVEQHRPNLFRTAVANIGPGESVEVEIGYLQTLSYVGGVFSLRFPMTVTPRFQPAAPTTVGLPVASDPIPHSPYAAAGANPNEAEIVVDLDPGFTLARVESLYHEMNIVEAGGRYALAPAGGSVPMDRDFELVWQPALGSEPEAAVFTETWQGKAYAMLMLMPPADAAVATGQPREIVLVIDTSGSMGGTSIVQARAALQFALGRLQPQDRFNVIRFSDNASAMFRHAMPADPGYLLHARRYADSLQADGGTNIAAALDIALDAQADERAAADGYLRQVVFITDGSVGNEQQLFTRIAARIGRTRLFTVGIGSAPNDWFMRKAAQFGRGTFTHIGADQLIEQRMESLLTRLESPVMQDIEVMAPAGAEVWPARVRDLYAGEPIIVRARLAQTGGEFTLRGLQAGSSWQRVLPLGSRPQQAEGAGIGERPGVAALWARAQIGSLIDTLVTGADADTVRKQVIDLALRHHLVSRYTSLVAVDRTPVRAPGMPLATKRVALTSPHGSRMLGYPAGATPAAQLALGGLLTLLSSVIAWGLLRRRDTAAVRLRTLRAGGAMPGR